MPQNITLTHKHKKNSRLICKFELSQKHRVSEKALKSWTEETGREEIGGYFNPNILWRRAGASSK